MDDYMSCVDLRNYAEKLVQRAAVKEKEVEDYLIKRLNIIMNTTWMKFIEFENVVLDGRLTISAECPSNKLTYHRTKDLKMLIELSLNTAYFEANSHKANRIPKAIFKVKLSDGFGTNQVSFLHEKRPQSKHGPRLSDQAILELETYVKSYKDKLPQIINNICELRKKLLTYPILDIQRTCLYLIGIGKFHRFLHKDICVLIAKNIWADRYNKNDKNF